MNTRVIVGYDGTKAATAALAWATTEALTRSAPLHIVSCYDVPVVGDVRAGFGEPQWYTRLLEDARENAEAARQSTMSEHPEMTIETIISAGPAYLELLDAATTDDVIVVGASQRHGTTAMLGSTPRRVTQHAPCPVIVVRGDGGTGRGPTRVVVGVDGSEDATRSTRWAAVEADMFGVELVVTHLWNYPYSLADRASAEARDTMRVDAACVLERSLEVAREITGGPVTAALIESDAVAGLIGLVREGDLLVLGSRGRGALRSALFGSMVNSMLEHSSVPVAVIPHDDHS